MVVIAQLVRASDCGSEGRGFEPRFPPFVKGDSVENFLFLFSLQKGQEVYPDLSGSPVFHPKIKGNSEMSFLFYLLPSS